jgi:hypothetical protein
VNDWVEHVPLLQEVFDDDVAENELPEMNPYLVPPLLENDIVYEHDWLMMKEVVTPVLPVVGEALQPFTV